MADWEVLVSTEKHGGTAKGVMNEILSDFDNMVNWKAITYCQCPVTDIPKVKTLPAKDVYLFAISDLRRRAYEYKDAI